MNRKLVLAMAAALALAVGCGDDDKKGGEGGMCSAETAATECTGTGSYPGCCTLGGTCGVTLANSTCQPTCGGTPCVAGAAGTVCCDEKAGLCGTADGDSCAVQPASAQCTVNGVATDCPQVGSSPGCCFTDTTGVASCGAYLNGACASAADVATATMPGTAPVTGDGGTTLTDGGTDASSVASIMCGTLTCQGQSLSGLGSLSPCCTDAGACGLDATLYGLGCDTGPNLIQAFLNNNQGDGGTTTDGGGTTTDGGGTTTDGGGTSLGNCDDFAMAAMNITGSAVETCCLPAGTCGINFIACIDPADFDAQLGTLTSMYTCTP